MFELIQHIPEPWRQLAEVLIAPLAWIPRLQHTLWDFFFAPGPLWLAHHDRRLLLFLVAPFSPRRSAQPPQAGSDKHVDFDERAPQTTPHDDRYAEDAQH